MSHSQRKPLPIYSFNTISKSHMHMKYTALRLMNPQTTGNRNSSGQCGACHNMRWYVRWQMILIRRTNDIILHFTTAIKITESQYSIWMRLTWRLQLLVQPSTRFRTNGRRITTLTLLECEPSYIDFVVFYYSQRSGVLTALVDCTRFNMVVIRYTPRPYFMPIHFTSFAF